MCGQRTRFGHGSVNAPTRIDMNACATPSSAEAALVLGIQRSTAAELYRQKKFPALLSEFPITDWEIGGAFALVAKFVHDWALGEAQGTVRNANASLALAASFLVLQHLSGATTTATKGNEDPSFEGLASLETEDPLSGAKLRMFLGEFE